MYRFLVIGGASLLLAACATTSGEDGEMQASAREPAVEDIQTAEGENLRCRRIMVTGSRFHTRVCRTTEEWAQMEQDAQEIRNRSGEGANRPDPANDSF